jgi:aspartyl-tRNA(Asn)/glutamyl-tRNA(Gln) amidotransferase subunit B
MEEGSLRCDANISIKPKGTTELGTRVEVKNLNSIKFVKKAIDHEVERLIEIVENGNEVQQETRSFDAAAETTFTLRSKEDANDYRYFIEPDLSPTVIANQTIEALKNELPLLPQQLKEQLIAEHQLSNYDANSLIEDIELVNYFNKTTAICKNAKAVVNFMNGPIKTYCNEKDISIENFSITPTQTAAIIKLIDNKVINFSTASGKLFNALIKDPTQEPVELVATLNLAQQNDVNEIETWIATVLEKQTQKVEEYKKGKKGLLGFFTGEVVKLSKGKADPKIAQELIVKALQ